MEDEEINNFIVKKIFILLIILILAGNVSAQELPDYSDKYVNDFADLFSDNETEMLRIILIELEKNTTAEVVVVTINTTSPSTPAEYRTKLFNYWQIGKKDIDNGLLILYSLNENRIEVETGYGLEGILPDSKLGRMLDEYYVPYRNNGNVSQGIIIFTQEIARVIQQNPEEIYLTLEIKNYFYDFIPYIIFIIIFIIMGFMSKRKRKKCNKDGLPMKYAGMAGGYYLYKCANGHIHKELKSNVNNAAFFGSSAGGFGGGGFSGGGFGGGMSGGGGAGR